MPNEKFFLRMLTLTLILTIIVPTMFVMSFAENTTSTENSQPNINANSLYNDRTMVLGNNVKNFVIVIPDEAHESLNQPKNQLPLTNQPYLPQHLVANVGTRVVWLSADVGHNHKITLEDSNSKNIYENAFFSFNEVSSPLTFNESGDYSYFEKDVNKHVPSFIMNGTISIVNSLPEPKSPQNVSSQYNQIGTVGAYMIPAIMLDKYTSEFSKKGFTVDSHFTYKDLRGGQKGTGPEQTLITWTTPETDISKVISALKEITPTLPYS